MLHYWEWLRNNVSVEDRILDIGINDANTWKGYGLNGIHNAKTVVPKYNVTGVDIDDIDNGFPLIRADAHKLPFKDNEFDIVILSQILEHVSDPIKVLNEAYRVCRKKMLITLPIGSSKDLEEHGDTLAKNNPWIKYKEFIPDTEIKHHAHIRVFNNRKDVEAMIPEYMTAEGWIEEEADGNNKWIAMVVTKENIH